MWLPLIFRLVAFLALIVKDITDSERDVNKKIAVKGNTMYSLV